jgi:hypothetical protein
MLKIQGNYLQYMLKIQGYSLGTLTGAEMKPDAFVF